MKIIKTGRTRAPIMIVYGPHKIGKSTFAAEAPNPIFIQTEDGLEGIETSATGVRDTYLQVMEDINWLREEKHDFKTLVIDSLDWLEALIFTNVCAKLGTLELNPPNSFGRGTTESERQWRDLLENISALNRERKMFVILLAHAKIEKYEDPELASFDRWSLDLKKAGSSVCCEFADIIGFATQDVIVKEEKQAFGAKAQKAKTSGERVLKLGKNPTYEAGNRYGLPDEIPLDVNVLINELKKSKPVKAGGDLEKVSSAKQTRDLAKVGGKKKKEDRADNPDPDPDGVAQAAANGD